MLQKHPSPHEHHSTPYISIANGIETNATSPLDPSGTMLLYTSNRSVASGLLGVRPLSEAQVAEYRFWRPCGQRVCAFGCGSGDKGEWAAAKRLFKGIDDVAAQLGSEYHGHAWDPESRLGGHGALCKQSDAVQQTKRECGTEEKASLWAGRRLVGDWGMFLSGCEREGVASF
ncbi:hypothetical protein ACN47E_003416 [Coniothyrium glycines]